ncbi:glycosyl transferase [Ottowia sp. GY511]|uniref:Biosynthetic peptidoglycan transglycosylase n=1 Tax=Ottowia flava TaxID=2675430 RepID=A0ABW4KZC7_9BURK|nr:biosynthetic peptidoglycan transglycosylase [Ottowia sp. GY511]TXK28564.1 glycosyl transferase [Ottowia sp. GY511]
MDPAAAPQRTSPDPSLAPPPRRWRSRLLRGLAVIGLTAAVLLTALWALLRVALMPQTGEWATELGRGPLALRAGVPQLVWLATTPWIGERLDGVRVATRLGPVTLGWRPAGAEGPQPTLILHCEPCTLPLPAAVGQDTLTVPAAQLALARDITDANGQHLRGSLLLGAQAPDGDRPVLAARWRAEREGPGWRVQLKWQDAPARDWVTLLGPDLPELASARIDGTLALSAELTLPGRALKVQPQLTGFAVQGLGTAEWAHLRPACGAAVMHDPRGWLARAVLAAEDQNFYEHPGYDLPALLHNWQGNQRAGAIAGGGSTITQQLAKLMVAGGDRTLQRKLRELLYAVEMEQTLGKARILQLYLNLAPWGELADGPPARRSLCGAEAAAQHWFGVPARRLSPRQAVTLAAMLRNPQHEAQRWAREGSVDPDRLAWIADQTRGVPIRTRRALAAQLAAERDRWVVRSPSMEPGREPSAAEAASAAHASDRALKLAAK